MSLIQTTHAVFMVDPPARRFLVDLDLAINGTWRSVPGEPHEQPRYTEAQEAAYRAQAEAAGHADLFLASLSHDLAHQIASEALGWRTAYSLFLPAVGQSCRHCRAPVQRTIPGVLDFEDTLAKAIQRAAQGLDWDRQALWWLKPEAVEALACRLKALLREAGL